jgi:hypothetical protein
VRGYLGGLVESWVMRAVHAIILRLVLYNFSTANADYIKLSKSHVGSGS